MKKKLIGVSYSFVLMVFLAGCSVNKAEIDNSVKSFFEAKHVEGCFTFLDNASGAIKVYNMAMDTGRISPFETFDIISSLVLLQTGVVTNEKMLISLDSSSGVKGTSQGETNIVNAFNHNVNPFFQKAINMTGKDTLQDWINRLGYGNKDISGTLDSFWLNNRLKISPDEQLGLLKRLYFEQLPFRKTVQASVKQMMMKENNSSYKFCYKGGAGFDESANNISWLNGWIEENNHVYFFSSVIKSKVNNANITSDHLEIVKNILTKYGFFKGRK